MFTKLKKNLGKKALLYIWLTFTTLYTVYGVYSYFKFSVYQAGVNAGSNAAVVQIMNDVASKKCSEPTQLFAWNTQLNLIDVACLEQPTGDENTSN